MADGLPSNVTIGRKNLFFLHQCGGNCTLQVEFHVPDFEIAINKTIIITSDIILRYEHNIMTYSNVLHNVLIMVCT